MGQADLPKFQLILWSVTSPFIDELPFDYINDQLAPH
jgi:hypothetical protein